MFGKSVMEGHDRSNLRRSSIMHFGVVAAATITALVVAVTWLGVRIDNDAFAHVVLLIGAAGCAIIGIIVWAAFHHDDRIMRPAEEMLANCEEIISNNGTHSNEERLQALKSLAEQRSIHDAMARLRLEVDRSKTGGPHAQIHSALNELQFALDETVVLDETVENRRYNR